MSIAIIDCGAGNLHSVRKAFVLQATHRRMEVDITTTPDALMRASHIVLPGVGTFADCMSGLLMHDGLKDALIECATRKATPLLGICVGMQMLFESGHEYGVTQGLGLFQGQVHKLTRDNAQMRIPHMGQNENNPAQMPDQMRVPHMGWNELKIHAPSHPFFKDIAQGAHAYFVHSYHAIDAQPHEVLASVDYGGDIVACIGRDNIVATQFHPEKSQALGLKLIDNFLGC